MSSNEFNIRNLLYFILAVASLLYLACIGYYGLSIYIDAIPSIEIINQIAETGYIGASSSFWGAIPLLIFAIFAFTNFLEKNLKIIFFIALILVIALNVIVLYFPNLLVG